MSLGGFWRAAIALVAATAALAPVGGAAQERTAPPFELALIDGIVPVARLTGPIEDNAVEAWLRLIAAQDFRFSLYLGRGAGGSLVAALQLADILRPRDTVVVVEEGGVCDTACSLVFLRARHSVTSAPLEITAISGPDWLQDAVVRALVDADVPNEVIAAFVAARGTVTRFELADLDRLGLRDRRGPFHTSGEPNRFDLLDPSITLPAAGSGRFTAYTLDPNGRESGEAAWFAGDHDGVRMLKVRLSAPSLGLDAELLVYDTGLPGVADRAMLLTVPGGGIVTPTFVGVPVPANVPLLTAIGPDAPAARPFVTATMPQFFPDATWIALSPIFANRNADLLATAEGLLFALELGDGRPLWLSLDLDGVGRRVLDEALAVWP